MKNCILFNMPDIILPFSKSKLKEWLADDSMGVEVDMISFLNVLRLLLAKGH